MSSGVFAFPRIQRRYVTGCKGILHFIMCFAINFTNAQVNSLNLQNIAKIAKRSCRILDPGSWDPTWILTVFHNYFDSEGVEACWVHWRDSKAVVSTQIQRLGHNYFYCKPNFSFGRLRSRHNPSGKYLHKYLYKLIAFTLASGI